MKAAILDGPNQVRIYDRSKPGLGREDVEIKVAYTGVCGSDIHMIKGVHKLVQFPAYPGHEFSGIVTARGTDVSILLGQSVAVEPSLGCMEISKCAPCRDQKRNQCKDFKVIGCQTDYGAFAEYISVPEYTVLPVKDIDLRLAALIEPASIGVHAARRGGINKDYRGRVFVHGAGTIGLMAMAAVKYLTNNNVEVVASDIIADRVKLAKRLGFADHTFVPGGSGQELVEQLGPQYKNGFDTVIDAACEENTLETAIQLAKVGSGIVVNLDVSDTPKHLVNNVRREVSVRGSRVCNRNDFPTAYEMIQKTALSNLLEEKVGDNESIHVFKSLDELPKAYQAAEERKFLKCLVKIGD